MSVAKIGPHDLGGDDAGKVSPLSRDLKWWEKRIDALYCLLAGVSLRVHDSTADMRYLVLPLRPANSVHLDEEQLAALVTRDSMIGVTLVQAS